MNFPWVKKIECNSSKNIDVRATFRMKLADEVSSRRCSITHLPIMYTEHGNLTRTKASSVFPILSKTADSDFGAALFRVFRKQYHRTSSPTNFAPQRWRAEGRAVHLHHRKSGSLLRKYFLLIQLKTLFIWAILFFESWFKCCSTSSTAH